jgi:hypothetical protein
VRQSAHDARSSCSNIHESLTGLFHPLHLRGARIIRRETPAVHGGGGVTERRITLQTYRALHDGAVSGLCVLAGVHPMPWGCIGTRSRFWTIGPGIMRPCPTARRGTADMPVHQALGARFHRNTHARGGAVHAGGRVGSSGPLGRGKRLAARAQEGEGGTTRRKIASHQFGRYRRRSGHAAKSSGASIRSF